MAVNNPFSITTGGITLGGTSDIYQLNGPYVVQRSYTAIRLVFEVVVVATSYDDLYLRSSALEGAWSRRLNDGEAVTITVDGSTWTYTQGDTLLDATLEINKTGNPDTDYGYARAYTLTMDGKLPADEDGGLQEIEVLVSYTPSRQRTVSVRGSYTAVNGVDAYAIYSSSADADILPYLTFVDSSAAWELVEETYRLDRHTDGDGDPNANMVVFTRDYSELLFAQSLTGSSKDDAKIRDHRITFTDLSTHPGDAGEDVYRLRRVVGTFDCSIDVTQTISGEEIQTVWRDQAEPLLKETFEREFSPQVFAVEETRAGYDVTSSRLSGTIQFLYQSSEGSNVVEVAQSIGYREARSPDYTPVHDQSELAFEVDVGWMTLERVWIRTVVAVGDLFPTTRIAPSGSGNGLSSFGSDLFRGFGGSSRGESSLKESGWNIISNDSQVSEQWVGDPRHTQMKLTTLSETVVQRYNTKPSGGSSTGTNTVAPGIRGYNGSIGAIGG